MTTRCTASSNNCISAGKHRGRPAYAEGHVDTRMASSESGITSRPQVRRVTGSHIGFMPRRSQRLRDLVSPPRAHGWRAPDAQCDVSGQRILGHRGTGGVPRSASAAPVVQAAGLASRGGPRFVEFRPVGARAPATARRSRRTRRNVAAGEGGQEVAGFVVVLARLGASVAHAKF